MDNLKPKSPKMYSLADFKELNDAEFAAVAIVILKETTGRGFFDLSHLLPLSTELLDRFVKLKTDANSAYAGEALKYLTWHKVSR